MRIYIVRSGDSYGDKSVEKAFLTEAAAQAFIEDLKESCRTKNGEYIGDYGLKISFAIDEIELVDSGSLSN